MKQGWYVISTIDCYTPRKVDIYKESSLKDVLSPFSTPPGISKRKRQREKEEEKEKEREQRYVRAIVYNRDVTPLINVFLLTINNLY